MSNPQNISTMLSTHAVSYDSIVDKEKRNSSLIFRNLLAKRNLYKGCKYILKG